MTIVPENDLNIMGTSTVAGGRYRKVNVMGELRVEGEIRCLSFNCMGDAVVEASFQSQKTSVMGDMEFRGTVDAGLLNVMGDATCLAGLRARKANCMGEIEVVGTFNADEVRLMGELKVGGDCNADRFVSQGAFRIGGLLSVDELEVVVWGPSRVAEIGGCRISVRRRRGILGVLWVWDTVLSALGLHERSGRLEADTVEGDDIRLEDTTAKVVRGRKVSIGPGCRIGRVEHGGEFSRRGDAEIGEVAAL
jgi:cytoskeletal protein CcmA (bactofilin family)